MPLDPEITTGGMTEGKTTAKAKGDDVGYVSCSVMISGSSGTPHVIAQRLLKILHRIVYQVEVEGGKNDANILKVPRVVIYPPTYSDGNKVRYFSPSKWHLLSRSFSIAMKILRSTFAQNESILPSIVVPTQHWITPKSYLTDLTSGCDVSIRIDGFAGLVNKPPGEYSDLNGILTIRKQVRRDLASSASKNKVKNNRFGIKRNRNSVRVKDLNIPPEDFRNDSAGGLRSIGPPQSNKNSQKAKTKSKTNSRKYTNTEAKSVPVPKTATSKAKNVKKIELDSNINDW